MYYLRCKTWAQAVELAAAKQRDGGAFYRDGETWVVCWKARPLKSD